MIENSTNCEYQQVLLQCVFAKAPYLKSLNLSTQSTQPCNGIGKFAYTDIRQNVYRVEMTNFGLVDNYTYFPIGDSGDIHYKFEYDNDHRLKDVIIISHSGRIQKTVYITYHDDKIFVSDEFYSKRYEDFVKYGIML